MAQRITNEVLIVEIRNLTGAVNKLDKRLDTFTPTVVLELKLKEIDLKILELQKEQDEIKADFNKMKQRSALQVWITGTLSATFGALMLFLVQYFLTNVGR